MATLKVGNLVFLAFLVAVVVGFAVFGAVMIDRRADYEDACAEAGGVAVKSYLGDSVCIDRDALVRL